MRQLSRALVAALMGAGLVAANPAGHALAGTVASLNEATVLLMRATQWPLLRQERALTMAQLAAYEAATACTSRYPPSAHAVAPAPGASVDAAVEQAVFRTLLALVPGAEAQVQDRRDRDVAALGASAAVAQGLAVGDAAAETILRWRSDDGADWDPAYTAGSGPGAYQPTGPDPMSSPRAGQMRPFALASYEELRPPPPPTPDSAQARRDLAEVMTLGGLHAPARSPAETALGRFHELPGFPDWNRVARQASTEHGLDDVATARVLALLDEAIMDTGGALWDAKYAYNAWRPVTAIRAGAAAAEGEAWTPLIRTPMHPEYPCGHCGVGSAAMTVLESVFGDGPFAFSLTHSDVTRQYRSFRDLAEQEAASRLFAGVHFRWSIVVGEALGHAVAERVLAANPEFAPTRTESQAAQTARP
jgi:hypothetical protein